MNVAWVLVASMALLAAPATYMGHRQLRGVRSVKTAVTAVGLAAVIIAFAASGVPNGGTLTPLAVRLLTAGLAATVIADWLLGAIDNSSTFAFGLAAFLVGYLLYGIALLDIAIDAAALQRAGLPWLLGGAYLAAIALGAWQYSRLTTIPAQLRAAVIAYVAVASNLLVAGVVHATLQPTRTTAAIWLLGTASIYLSDSLIAHNLFRSKLRAEELWIMPTYYIGQLAIVGGLLLELAA